MVPTHPVRRESDSMNSFRRNIGIYVFIAQCAIGVLAFFILTLFNDLRAADARIEQEKLDIRVHTEFVNTINAQNKVLEVQLVDIKTQLVEINKYLREPDIRGHK